MKAREAQRLKDEEAQIGAEGKGEDGEEEPDTKKGKKKAADEEEEEEIGDDDEEEEGGSKEYSPDTYRSGSPLKKNKKAN